MASQTAAATGPANHSGLATTTNKEYANGSDGHIGHDTATGASAGGRLRAFGGDFQPGTYLPQRKFANAAPLGLSAFALTTFVLSLINMGTRGVAAPNLVVGVAFGYGGLVQLLAGMW